MPALFDPSVGAHHRRYRCCNWSAGGSQRRRVSLRNVVRRGRVIRVTPGEIVLEHGSIRAVDLDQIVVDCSALGSPSAAHRPVFDGDRVNLLTVRTCQPTFSASLIAYVERHLATEAEKNACCRPSPVPNVPADWMRMWWATIANRVAWSQNPDLTAWLMRSRLDNLAISGATAAASARRRSRPLREAAGDEWAPPPLGCRCLRGHRLNRPGVGVAGGPPGTRGRGRYRPGARPLKPPVGQKDDAAAAPAGPRPFGDDAAIVHGCRRGEPRARAALCERYADQVHRVLYRVLGFDRDLADLHHDVFVRAIGSIGRIDDPSALKPWITSIAVHVARSAIARRRRQRWLSFRPWEDLPEIDACVASGEVLDALGATYAILGTLPADERIAFALRFIDGMELTEVAAACGTSLATVKRRLARAGDTFAEQARRHPALETWVEGGTRWASPKSP